MFQAPIMLPSIHLSTAGRKTLTVLLMSLAMLPLAGLAQDPGAAKGVKASTMTDAKAKAIGQQVRNALESGVLKGKELTVEASEKPRAEVAAAPNPKASRKYIRAKAAALAAGKHPDAQMIEAAHAADEVHWDYQGANGPLAWADLKPEFATCGSGKRQSPINIDQSVTLRGPAEAIGFDYQSGSSGTVVNNGHTIQIDVNGDNGIVVRGSRFQLLQLHFHHPSEERINHRSFAMVAHLVHKDYMGRLAVVAVLLEAGAANPVINNFWTYMPLGPGDRVQMPLGLVDMNGLLPKDQRYYQFMGSLTTPPCSEEVLWMILKQPVTISQEQIQLFAQQYPNNARPVQPINGRVIRDAQ
jgi:carbonic anhydrase